MITFAYYSYHTSNATLTNHNTHRNLLSMEIVIHKDGNSTVIDFNSDQKMHELYNQILQMFNIPSTQQNNSSIIRIDTGEKLQPDDNRDLCDAGITPETEFQINGNINKTEESIMTEQIPINTFGLELDEFLAIQSYTNTAYSKINEALRENNGSIASIKDDDSRYQAYLIHNGIAKLIDGNKHLCGIVYRGSKIKTEVFKGLQIGQNFRFNSFVSTSKQIDAALKFASEENVDPNHQFKVIVFEIDVARAADLKGIAITRNAREEEVLLSEDAEFQIDSIFKQFAFALIRLTQVA